ncbi:hypothetical protein SANTM175S_09130 [Streptomyces antimycoticus]
MTAAQGVGVVGAHGALAGGEHGRIEVLGLGERPRRPRVNAVSWRAARVRVVGAQDAPAARRDPLVLAQGVAGAAQDPRARAA